MTGFLDELDDYDDHDDESAEYDPYACMSCGASGSETCDCGNWLAPLDRDYSDTSLGDVA